MHSTRCTGCGPSPITAQTQSSCSLSPLYRTFNSLQKKVCYIALGMGHVNPLGAMPGQQSSCGASQGKCALAAAGAADMSSRAEPAVDA